MDDVPHVCCWLNSGLGAHWLSTVRVNDNWRRIVGHEGMGGICDPVTQLLMNSFRLQLWSGG